MNLRDFRFKAGSSRDERVSRTLRHSVTSHQKEIQPAWHSRPDAFSDGTTTPEDLRINTLGNISKETERLLFKSNPELNGFSKDLIASHHKREMMNIDMLERIDQIHKIKDEKEKSLKDRVIRKIKVLASKPDELAFDLSSVQKDKILYEWHQPNKGSIVLQDFTLFRPYSFIKGGQGSIHSVTLRLNNNKYVMKVKQKLALSHKSWLLEHREHTILQTLNHPLIVSLHHVFCTKNTIILVMEHLVGGCLWKHVANKGLLPESLCAYYSACVLLAIQYLHDHNIMFRDLKSANIVLDWYRRPKLVDLGMAKYFIDHEPPEMKGMIQNTEYSFAGYLAPEIYLSPATTGPKVDIWGLGYIIMEIQLGYGVYFPLPWAKESRQHLTPEWRLALSPKNKNMSAICQNLLMRLLQQDPESRPSLVQIKSHVYFKNIQWQNLCMAFGPNIEAVEGIDPRSWQKNHNCQSKLRRRSKTKTKEKCKRSKSTSQMVKPRDSSSVRIAKPKKNESIPDGSYRSLPFSAKNK